MDNLKYVALNSVIDNIENTFMGGQSAYKGIRNTALMADLSKVYKMMPGVDNKLLELVPDIVRQASVLYANGYSDMNYMSAYAEQNFIFVTVNSGHNLESIIEKGFILFKNGNNSKTIYGILSNTRFLFKMLKKMAIDCDSVYSALLDKYTEEQLNKSTEIIVKSRLIETSKGIRVAVVKTNVDMIDKEFKEYDLQDYNIDGIELKGTEILINAGEEDRVIPRLSAVAEKYNYKIKGDIKRLKYNRIELSLIVNNSASSPFSDIVFDDDDKAIINYIKDKAVENGLPIFNIKNFVDVNGYSKCSCVVPTILIKDIDNSNTFNSNKYYVSKNIDGYSKIYSDNKIRLIIQDENIEDSVIFKIQSLSSEEAETYLSIAEYIVLRDGVTTKISEETYQSKSISTTMIRLNKCLSVSFVKSSYSESVSTDKGIINVIADRVKAIIKERKILEVGEEPENIDDYEDAILLTSTSSDVYYEFSSGYQKDGLSYYLMADSNIMQAYSSLLRRAESNDKVLITNLDKFIKAPDRKVYVQARKVFINNFYYLMTSEVKKLTLRCKEKGNGLMLHVKDISFAITACENIIERHAYSENELGNKYRSLYENLLVELKDIDNEYNSSEYAQAFDIRDYIKGELKPVPYEMQYEGANDIIKSGSKILGDPMGLGKTKTAILASAVVQAKKVIVCPKTLILKWCKEIVSVVPKANIGMVNSPKASVQDLAQYDWLLVNYEKVSKMRDVLFEYKEFVGANNIILMCDEAHRLGGIDDNGEPTAVWTSVILDFALKSPEIEVKIPITGTPIRDRVKTFCNILKLVDCPLAFDSMYYLDRYCMGGRTRYGGASNLDELAREVKNYIIRRTEIKELNSKKVRNFNPIDIGEEGYMLYQQWLREYSTNHNIEWILAKYNALKQGIAHIKIDYTIERTKEIIEEGNRVVIFTNYLDLVDKCYNKLSKYKVRKITSRENTRQRQEAQDLLNSKDIDILVCTPGAGGEGLDFIGADVGIINDYGWTFTGLAQAEDRLDRINRTDICSIIYMYASNIEIEEYIMKLIEDKLSNVNDVLVEGSNANNIGTAIAKFLTNYVH